MSRDVRTRKVAGVESPINPTSPLSVTDDSDDKSKESDVIGALFPTALLLLCFVLPLVLFFMYSSTAPSANQVLRGAQATLKDTVRELPPLRALEVASTPAPAPQWRHPLQQDAGLPAGPEKSAPAPAAVGTMTMVHCATTAGPIIIEIHQDWAPLGAERFLEMVRSGFFSTQVALFRAVRGFLVQTGIPGDPAVVKSWKAKGSIQDDVQWLDQSDQGRMKRGYLSFAGGGKNTRGTEFFFSFRDIALGTSSWEVPFGTLVGDESFQTMDHWYTGYGDLPAFGGKAPAHDKMYADGLSYLQKDYPEIDYISSCDIAESKPRMTEIPGFATTYEKLMEGSGAGVQKGNTVTVHATGVVQQTGKKFWSTKDMGQQPFSYKAGVGQVITGWDQGLLGMKLGEERKIVIPAEEGYGAAGFPAWGIPAGSTLEFTLEVLSINVQ